MIKTQVDIVIIGGGIAGLWTLAQAKTQGLNAILLEKNALGAGQTLSSQGIIHGGSKYALAGSLSKAAHMISDMPKFWQNCINGKADIHLSEVKVLSDTQYLIPSSGIDTQLLSFLGSKNMASHTEKLNKNALPKAYTDIGIHRSIFRLNEIVLDVNSIIKSFISQWGDSIYQADISANNIQERTEKTPFHCISLPQCQIECAYIVYAAGEGNAALTGPSIAMQTRPLHMVMMHSKSLPAIFAHFIGRSTKPLLTVTSHRSEENTIWYMGGDLAENGVDKTPDQQIDATRALLKKLLPSVSLHNMDFTTHRISRAEPQQAGLTRPDDAFVLNRNNIISGWPTKLALAPRFAEKVLAEIKAYDKVKITTATTLPLPKALIAQFPWDLP